MNAKTMHALDLKEKKCTYTYCGTHRVEGMINLSLKRCQDDECKKEARFGFKGKKPAYCLRIVWKEYVIFL